MQVHVHQRRAVDAAHVWTVRTAQRRSRLPSATHTAHPSLHAPWFFGGLGGRTSGAAGFWMAGMGLVLDGCLIVPGWNAAASPTTHAPSAFAHCIPSLHSHRDQISRTSLTSAGGAAGTGAVEPARAPAGSGPSHRRWRYRSGGGGGGGGWCVVQTVHATCVRPVVAAAAAQGHRRRVPAVMVHRDQLGMRVLSCERLRCG